MLFPPLTLVRKTMASYYSPGHDWTERKDLTNCRDIVQRCSKVLFEKTLTVCLKCLQSETMREFIEQFFNALHLSNVFFHDKNFLALYPLSCIIINPRGWRADILFLARVAWVWTCGVTVRHCSKMFPKHGWPSKVRTLWITPVIFRNTFCFLIVQL